MCSGFSKFLIVGETNSMVGYHLIAEGQSIQLGVLGGTVSPPAGLGKCLGGENFLKIFLSIGPRKLFERLTIDTF